MKESTLIGFSSLSTEEITKRVTERDCWGELAGDFIAVTEEPGLTTITSSVIGASPYYYCLTSDGTLIHGSEFFDVFHRSALPWKWNTDALQCLALLGHLLGQDTLHPAIFRVPPASELRFSGGDLRVRVSEFWPTLLSQSTADRSTGNSLECAIRTLEESFSSLPLANPVLSLSAGFDSRVLMALCLAAKVRPRVITFGASQSTDTKIARELAARVGWDCERIELSPAEYLPNGGAIARATGGVKTAANWHTFLYPKRAGLGSDSSHIVGSNGEFARTYYFGGSDRSQSLSHLPGWLVAPHFFARAARRIVKFDSGWRFLASPPKTLASVCRRIVDATTPLVRSRNLLVALDGFYAIERVRHFIGAGLACYRRHGIPVSPFLDARWLRSIMSLARRDQLSERFHRASIERYAPALSSVPFNRDATGAQVGYNVFPDVIALSKVQSSLRTDSLGLSELLTPDAIPRMLSQRSLEDLSLLMVLRETARIVGQQTGGQCE